MKGTINIFGFKLQKKWFGIAVAILGLFIFYPIIRSLIAQLTTGAAAAGANSILPTLVAADADPDAIRTDVCTSVAQSMHDLDDSWFIDRRKVVTVLNSLRSVQEVRWTSAYYNQAYGSSLKSVTLKLVGSNLNPVNWFEASKWTDLKEYVQNNLS